ncbi:hypothetical protein, partial [Leptospira borgpetersenii]|uniref:hypothetical protein n=1 Tax=Leptospira borgpetersenii TaxID=174 RepID=UPI001D158E9B
MPVSGRVEEAEFSRSCIFPLHTSLKELRREHPATRMNADPKFQDQLEALSELVRMTIKKRPKIDSPIVTLSKIRRILIVIHSNAAVYLRVKFIFLILALSKKRHKLREQIMKDVVRYESNPFIEGMVVPIRG